MGRTTYELSLRQLYVRVSFIMLSQSSSRPTASITQETKNSTPPQEQNPMEESGWEQRINAVTCILTQPTTAPSLYSQLFISTQIPCYLSWDFPPFLCKANRASPVPLLLHWGISLFFKRLSRFCLPETSWRCKCPFQQPPPIILAAGVDPAPPQLNEERRREYVRKRFRRKPLVSNVPPLIPFVVPNLLLFLLLLWNPLSLQVPRKRPWKL